MAGPTKLVHAHTVDGLVAWADVELETPLSGTILFHCRVDERGPQIVDERERGCARGTFDGGVIHAFPTQATRDAIRLCVHDNLTRVLRRWIWGAR